jgi:CRP-like cAMP-binding protein
VALIRGHLQEQEFREDTILWEAGEPVSYVFFPTTGMISVRVPVREDHGIEVAVIGRESGTPLPEVLDAPAVTRGVVQVPGRFLKLSAPVFAAAAQESEEVARLAAAGRTWVLAQSQRIAACSAVHPADARFSRWLLRAADALGGDTVPVTQEAIAEALGIRRTTATLIAQGLQMGGAITYSRGRIAIRDRTGLEAAACDCHKMLDRRHWPSEQLRRDRPAEVNGHTTAAAG